ncbi:Fic family protein [Phytoactinopolyspora mesophila]|uniref:Fic family protein n=1 Tax=Phytoactinopolyspora mesophila TaxID=2650750 RepID=A0A7K3M3P9_9ACTN|nr:Fic family protein [Phytoactinopolyspora mesophila]NDL57866.1 Fic family protein [Phytoactinopolyspora mesophila]
MSHEWPAHRHEIRPWRQAVRGGTRDDRMLSEIEVALPPLIADISISVDGLLASVVEQAAREVTALDTAHGRGLGALGVLLLRTESVASSKIEQVEASIDDYARALHGIKTNSSAASMVAATEALDTMIAEVERTRLIDVSTMTSAHAALLRDDPVERHYAGRLRDVQNWIGGSDYSPRHATYVPPPWETVVEYMDDLVRFANRDDVPALVQAAIAHAQFESIHPFTDGNGRIGRALINAILRRRGATKRIVVPLASALVANRDGYFGLLNDYRRGEFRAIVRSFASASLIAASESYTTAERLTEIESEWRTWVGRTRRGSAVDMVLALLPAQPVISAEDVCGKIAAPVSSVYAAIDRLRDAGVLRPLTERKRNQVWGAGLILDELDDLGMRIADAARDQALL